MGSNRNQTIGATRGVGHNQSKWEVTQRRDPQTEDADFALVLHRELTQLPSTDFFLNSSNWLPLSPHLIFTSQFLLFCECALNLVLYDLSILAL